jgi:hypothetical protein
MLFEMTFFFDYIVFLFMCLLFYSNVVKKDNIKSNIINIVKKFIGFLIKLFMLQ